MCSATAGSLWPDMTEGVMSPSGSRSTIPGRYHGLRCSIASRSANTFPGFTAEFATRWWHWFFFAQPEIPERVINADSDRWYHGDPEAMGQENYDEWRTATRNPDVVRAMLEDYRAGLTVDRRHEQADRAAGNRLRPPLLGLWSQRDDLEDLYGDPLVIWRDWADDVRGHRIDSAHHMAEEAPEELAVLGGFFSP
jgi:haloacetate dehalogenase